MTQVQVIARPILLAWLFVETLWDFRDHNIPRWFSIVPLTAGLFHLAWGGNWLAAGLMAVSILGTNIASRWRYFVVIVPILVLVFIPGVLPLAAGWSLLYLAWELGWMGGADALAGAYLLIWYPDLRMLAAIWAGILVWNFAAALQRYGKETGLRIWTMVLTRSHASKTPGLGAFLIALIMRLVLL